MEAKPKNFKIPSFRRWLEKETGLVHVLVDITDRELEAFWFAYLREFFDDDSPERK